MIRVRCPQCFRSIRLADDVHGQKIQCKCGCKIVAPGPEIVSTAPPVKEPTIRFGCPSCQGVLEVKSKYAGEITRCKCGTKIRIPGAEQDADDDTQTASHSTSRIDFGASDVTKAEFLSASSVGIDSRSGLPIRAPSSRRYRAQPKTVYRKSSDKSFDKPVRSWDGSGISMDGFILVGAIGMTVAVVWFVMEVSAGVPSIFPPILFVAALGLMLKGVLDL